MTTNGKKVAVNLPPELVERLRAREDTYPPSAGRPAEVPIEPLRKAASRYFSLIERELAVMNLSEAEASLICDALNGTDVWDWGCLGSFSASMVLRAELFDACNPDIGDIAAKWGVDGPKFLDRVSQWSESQALAIVDAAERFWADCENSTVHSVGLVQK